jgi:hypothetical protein
MSARSGTYVFLGPTLSHAEARKLLEAHYLPPVAMGDVVRLLERRPATIAIVDGLFEQTPAVWHKEILFALQQGVRVLGASSMGALRAAELHVYGMEGVGEIFEAFRDGRLEDDDEVAVAHAPASDGFRPISDAMVNLREGLRQAQAGGLVSASTAAALVKAAKQLYYPERTWHTMIDAAAGLPPEELTALRRFVSESRPDLKRADAVRLLQHLANRAAPPPRVDFDFEPTYHWNLMRAGELGSEGMRALGAALDPSPSPAVLARQLRLRQGGDPAVAREALLYALLTAEATRDPSLADAAQVASMDQAMPGPLAPTLARLEATAEALTERRRADVESFVPLALARRGQWQAAIAELGHTRQALAERGLDRPSLADAGLTEQELLAWYAARRGHPPRALAEQARAAGFDSAEELLEELIRYYLAEKFRG